MTEPTFDRSGTPFILDALDLELDEYGHVMYESGGYVGTVCGKDSLRVDEIGMFAHVEEAPQETLLVCDNFSCIVGWESDRRDDN